MLSDQDLQQAFQVSYILHPDRLVAWEVAREGVRRTSLVLSEQARLPNSDHPYKQKLSEQNALLSGVFAASEGWELDQESRQPTRFPLYVPTNRDFLPRYIKNLVWHSMARNASWVSIAIGNLLYGYQLNEIAQLSPDYFESLNARRIRANLLERLQKRFGGEGRLIDRGSELGTRLATHEEFRMIELILAKFSPRLSHHPDRCVPGNGILETYLSYPSGKSEAELIHVLINSECGGWVRLVREFNYLLSLRSDKPLPDPTERLRIPLGSEILYPIEDSDPAEGLVFAKRINPESLNVIELKSLGQSGSSNNHLIEIDKNIS
jgi:hypothetical protein